MKAEHREEERKQEKSTQDTKKETKREKREEGGIIKNSAHSKQNQSPKISTRNQRQIV